MKVAGRKIVGSTCTPASAGAERDEGGLHLAGDLQGVARGLLLDDQQQARPVVDDRVADGGAVVLDDGGDVAEAGRVGPRSDGHHGELGGGAGCRLLAHREALVGPVEEAPSAGSGGFLGGAHHVAEADALRLEAGRVDAHLELPVALPPDGHVGHAGDGHEPRAHDPAHQVGELHLGEGVGPDADLHRAAQRGERREDHRRSRGGRELRGGAGEALLHELSGDEEVGALAEDEQHGREAQHGLGAQGLETTHPVEGALQGHGHEALDLLGGEGRGLGLHLHSRRRELGEDVERRGLRGAHPYDHEDHGERGHHDTEPKGEGDEGAHRQCPAPNSVP